MKPKLVEVENSEDTELNSKKSPYQSHINRHIPFIPASNFLYKRQGPWPQPAPNHPFGMSPAVVHIPSSEKSDFNWHIGLRYLKQLIFGVPDSYILAKNTTIVDTSAKEFNELFYNTLFCKLLNPNLGASDKTAFKPVLKEGESYYKVDLSVMEHVLPYPGQFTAPCIGLFRKTENGIESEAIHINNILIKKTDGEAYELAKHYLIQGASNVTTLTIHPLLHLPYDTINAITKTALPKDHVLVKLLLPHCRFTLELNRTVTLSKESILRNWRDQVYGCYPGPSAGLQDLFVAGYNGIKNNTSYKPYKLPSKPPHIPTPYGDFLQAYYDTIYSYVKDVVNSGHITKNCPYVKAWADYIHHWTDGFPSGNKIFEGDNLVSAVAMFIWDTSVAHSLDHMSFGRMPMDKVTMRMRIAPPGSTKINKFDRSKLVTVLDTMKFEQAQKMFYRPTTVTRLMDVDCKFTQPDLVKLNAKFRQDLAATADRLKDNEQISLTDIAASVQY